MYVFTNVEAAIREGFQVLEFDQEYKMYLVEKTESRGNRLVKMVAFAKK